MREKRRLPIVVLVATMLAAAVSPAFGSKKTAMKVYFGASVSTDSTDYKDPDFFVGSVDDGTGFSVSAGFPFLPYAAAEVGYVKIGDADFDGLWQ